jgi:uncharacterized membrane protein SirB2
MIAFGAIISPSHEFSKRFLAILHGVGLIILLISGFGMMARLGVSHSEIPGWIIAKTVTWIALGAMLAIIKRRRLPNMVSVFAVIGLAGFAAYCGIMKPF